MNRTRLSLGLLCGIVVTLLVVACKSTPIGYVKGFERFVIRIEENASNYTQEQWKQNDGQLQNYIERYRTEKTKLSPDDKRKVGELTVRYYRARVKFLGLNILDEVGDWLDYIDGFADEIKKDVENYQNQ